MVKRPVKREKFQKYPKEEVELPPEKFDRDYESFFGISFKTKQKVQIAFDRRRKPRSSKFILYFRVILLRYYKGKWRHILVFDTFHQGLNYVHGHRRINLSNKREDIGTPRFNNFKNGMTWVKQHLERNWNSYVTKFFRDIYAKKRRRK